MRTFLLMMNTIMLMTSCSMTLSKPAKINGVSFVASRDSISEKHVNPVANLNANYAAIMPFGIIKDLAHPEIYFDSDKQWFGETEEGTKQYSDELKKKGIRIMLKPQLWVSRGEFTGFIKMNSDDDWEILEATYSKFIMEYARVAKSINADIFCIGTELENFVEARPEYWHKLIKDIRKIYKGKLTYAANWSEFNKTPFWSELDYIGVDAYFPLSEEKTPTLEKSRAGWQSHKAVLKQFYTKYEKPILFTEYGYRSIDYAGKQPWKVDREDGKINLEAQSVLTQSLFHEFWHEDWFAGGFVWKWFHDYENVGGHNNNRFTPQNKPAEQVLKSFYSKQ
jgi:hypothetical protein